MPWEEKKTDELCRHCTARGFKNVHLIHETFWYETTRYRKVYSPKECLELGIELGDTVAVKGVGYPTDKRADGTTGLRTRFRCPHWPCKSNQPIRERNKAMRAKHERPKNKKRSKKQ